MRLGIYHFILCSLLLSPEAFAVLTSNPLLQEVGSLPRGRFMVSMVYFESDIQSQYQNQGQTGSIAQEFNRSLLWNDLATDDPEREVQFRGLLDSKGLKSTGTAGEIVGDFDGLVRGRVPVIGYGITDRINLFVASSYVNFRAESDLTYRASPESQLLVQSLSTSGMHAAAQDLAQSLNQSADDQLFKAGYDYRRSVEQSAWGDTRLETLWTPKIRSNSLKVQLAPIVIVPTGKESQVSDIYGFATGDGRWWLGAKTLSTWQLIPRFKVSAGFSFLVPQNHTRAYRIPDQPGDRLSSDIDSNVRVTQGLRANIHAHQTYQISRSWDVALGFERQFAQSPRFNGNRFESERYQWISDRATGYLDTITAQLRLNTIEAFLAQQFLIPTQFSLGAGLPVSGKNSSSNPVIALQGAVFF